MIGFLIVSLVVGVWIMRRRHTKDARAGLVAERPTFSVQPAARRWDRHKDGLL